jgi:Trypsin-like peptidase domain
MSNEIDDLQPTDMVRSSVFPIVYVKAAIGGCELQSYVGTAFFIGRRGFALTAAHVLTSLQKPKPAHGFVGLLYDNNGAACFVSIANYEIHPTEDIAILKLEIKQWNSPFHFYSALPHASLEYDGWGYPSDSAILQGDIAIPDLVYSRGYVRRRVTRQVDGLTGTQFIELSEPPYPGASGGPLVYRDMKLGLSAAWRVVGVFSGIREQLYSQLTAPVVVGYAVRADAFREWKPDLLSGISIEAEAAEGTLGIR